MKQVKTFILGLAVMASLVSPMGAAIAAPAGSDATSGANMDVVNEAVQQSTMLLQLKQKLAQAQYRYFLLQNNVEEAKTGLEDLHGVIENLESEIENLDYLVKDTKKQILSVKSQVERKKMDLADLEEQVQVLELQLEDQKELVGQLMKLLYVKKGIYYDNNEVNAVKILAGSDSVSETLQQMTYLDLIEAENQAQIQKMADMSAELSGKWDEIREKQDELSTLDAELAEKLAGYEAEKLAQEAMLEETKNQEEIFTNMIEAAAQNEDSLLREIEIYKKNVDTLEAKLSGSTVMLSEEEQDLITKIEEDLKQSFDVAEAANFLDLDWPVSPGTGLTAFFHDGGYQAVFGVDHYALDIRAKHGTEIHAPADGVVAAVVFDPESAAYAYIKLAHRKGVMTVYGHVSGVNVEVGDYVSQGDLIGYTGATPGSVGAGVRTTGPHLHFEVWQDGVLVDPLKYMPLEEVPAEYLPEEYLQQVQDELEGQIQSLEEQLGF